ncbi:carbohydrate ABC transporter permease [Corynebacterium uterequi]|uniref:Permease component of ABC-type sugar transporter n=1 Tax=Corynebacterium uterequi TaxID=1072256 RepID=A0A0G3HF32_9CORY|nr:sugar ABC transporter permease [Corynebacterium uterequi]AKK10573.1 permease component of ABC-type sugar transporter [Corynebacterium uterequi]
MSKPPVDQLGKSRKDALFSYAVIAPAMVILFGFTLLPFVLSVWKSLFNKRGEFTFTYYAEMASDSVFHQVLWNNFIFAVVTVPATIFVALGLALLVVKVVRGSSFARTMLLSPTILPVVAAGAVWLYFFQPSFGLLNQLLKAVGLGHFMGNWLGDVATAMPAVMIVSVWQQAGLFVLFYIAALLSIDPQLKEASLIEGASDFYNFRRVTWPMLMPTTLFVAVMATANAFKQVDLLFVLTQGGPNNTTNLLLYHIWKLAFSQFRDGYAAAVTVLLVVVLLIVAIVQIRVSDKRIHYR